MTDVRPSTPEVRQQLARILGSEEFGNATQLRRFLEYVVEEELGGRADKIKAYTIAVTVLGREDSFDPQVDPVVRIQAGRLRRALERYYLGSGQQDPIHIHIPKGTYVPRFAVRGSAAEPTAGTDSSRSPSFVRRRAVTAAGLALVVMVAALLAAWPSIDPFATKDAPRGPRSPSLLMLPLTATDGDRVLAEGFTAEILADLSRYTELFVFAPETSFRIGADSDVRSLAETYRTRYVLRGNLTRDGAIRIGLQLIEASSGQVVWADSFSIEQTGASVFAAQAEIAKEVVRQIAEPYGAIGTADFALTRGKPPSSMDAYECVLRAYDYRRRFDFTGYEDAKACLIQTVRANPTYADAWTMLALIYVDESRFSRMDEVPSSTMDLALEAAERAIALTPASAGARRALISVHFFRQDPEKGFAEGERALELNPNSAEVLFELGLRHVLSGDVGRGLELLENASVHNPAAPEAYQLGLALGYFRKGETTRAVATLERTPPRANFIYWAIAAAIFGKAGATEGANQARAQLLTIYPDFAQAAMDEMRRRSVAPDLVASLVEGWRLAGIPIVKAPNS
jgi:TolB-like protein/Tfp pilus assembly protein PilF